SVEYFSEQRSTHGPFCSGSTGKSSTFQSRKLARSIVSLPRSRSTRAAIWFWLPPVRATVLKLLIVPDGVTTPGLLAVGQRLRSALDVGLMRLAGITLPWNGVGVAVLPGHAPTRLTVPAQGSISVVFIAEKLPARSADVGTVAVNGSPVRSRKLSQLVNQNVRLRPL